MVRIRLPPVASLQTFGSRRHRSLIATSWGFAVAGLVMAIFVQGLVFGLAGFTVELFSLGFAIAPLWTATMDIAPGANFPRFGTGDQVFRNIRVSAKTAARSSISHS